MDAMPGDDSQQRQHWIPFFDDVQAIIFLAPLAFNLTLEEDPKVNRLVRKPRRSHVALSVDTILSYPRLGGFHHALAGSLHKRAAGKDNTHTILE